MKEIESLAREAEKNICQDDFIEGFIIGFRKALDMAFHTAVQWPNNPTLETMKEILKIGDTEVKE